MKINTLKKYNFDINEVAKEHYEEDQKKDYNWLWYNFQSALEDVKEWYPNFEKKYRIILEMSSGEDIFLRYTEEKTRDDVFNKILES